MSRFRTVYGAGPLHLLGALLCFAIAAYALSRALDNTGNPDRLLLWLGGSIVAHDLLLLPLYSLIGALALLLVLPPGRPRTRLRIAALNHLRVPALASGLLLLVWFPLIAGPAERTFMRATGLSKDVYLDRWLWLTAALFCASIITFALRARRLTRTEPPSRYRAGTVVSRRADPAGPTRDLMPPAADETGRALRAGSPRTKSRRRGPRRSPDR